MATVDDTIYLETGETKVVVHDPTDLPTAKEFTEAFKATQKEERNGPTRITIYFTLLSKPCMELYSKTNVYVKQDAFQRNAVVSPGSIINVHPILVQKEDLKNEIRAHMTKLPAPETEDATQWLSQYHPEY
eukprot:575983-Ditylum_brightwellii.AAC.1